MQSAGVTSRRGSALFATLAALLVLTVLAASYAGYARHQGRLTHRHASAEAAHQLALSGVAALRARLSAADAAPGGPVARVLAGTAPEVAGVALTASSGEAGPLARLVAQESPADAAYVTATATFHDWKPIYPAGFRTAGGVATDPLEKHGRVRIVARARHGGVEREVECLLAAKVVRPVLPVLPRFTVFARRSPGDAALNRMEVDKKLVFPRAIGRVRPGHDALVLAHAREPYAPGELARVLDRSGWVFLGGEAPWAFQLAFGGGEGEPHADGFLLPPQAYRFSGEEEAGAVLGPEGQELMRTTFGLMKVKTGLFTGVKSDSRMFARYPFTEPVRCASLKLYGSAERPSPTVVLGRAVRRSLVFSYLTNPAGEPEVTRTCFLPYLPLTGDDALGPEAGLFRFSQPPFDRETVLARLFGDSVSAYEPFASTVLEEPFARSLDHLETNLRGPAGPDGYDPPAALGEPKAFTRLLEPLDEDAGPRFFYDASARVRLIDAAREAYFEGDLDRLDVSDLLLPERATYVFSRAQWERWTRAGMLAVRGIMVADPRDGPLVIDRPLKVVEGGVLVARGDVRIDADVVSAPGSRVPLALVSLEGRIVVAARRVDAQLVALGPDGTVTREGEGPLALTGGIAATTLDVPALSAGADAGRVTKTLTWDERADPARRADLPLSLHFDTGRTVTLR